MEHRPKTPAEVVELLCEAAKRDQPMAIEGQGSKRDWGRPVDGADRLCLAGLSGILSYDPAELVLSALAGTPMLDIHAALAEERQHLSFEPPDLGPVWGGHTGAGTLGGVIACNLSGPRRPSAGAARDHFLGFRAVNGLGQEFKSGGKVVKNVTGYDLPKLLAGSFGTLGVMTEITVKTMPAPVKQRTAIFAFSQLGEAHAFLIRAQQSDFELDGAALLPEAVQKPPVADQSGAAGPILVACRMSGTQASVSARCAALLNSTDKVGGELHTQNSAAFWLAIRDLAVFLPIKSGSSLWRISVPPAEGADVAARLQSEFPGANWYLDWGGGLMWLLLPDGDPAEAGVVRSAIAPGKGHATLLCGPESLRAAIDPFPIEPGTAILSSRVKAAFDPKGLLNPRRLHRDW